MAKTDEKARKMEAMVKEGLRLAKKVGHPPTFSEYGNYREELGLKFSEWQIYREFGGHKGAWSAYQYLIIEAQMTES